MPLCVPMPWCGGEALEDAPRAAHAARAAAGSARFWRIAVVRGDDLDFVESKLRQLYHTTAGQPCQALLTTEYRQWKRLVLQTFLNFGGDAGWARAGADSGPRCRFPSHMHDGAGDAVAAPRPLVAAIEAFLPGYHLLYVQGSVDINPHEPVTRAHGGAKRAFCELELGERSR
jgi:hypothetical protein